MRARGTFAAVAAAVYAVLFFVTRTPASLGHARLMGAAATADLALTVPLLYWLMVGRAVSSSWLGVMSISLAGMKAAGLLLPAPEQVWLPSLRWIGIPVELWVVARIVRRIRSLEPGGDALTRIRNAARALLPSERVGQIVAAEIAVLYYALFSWRAKPEERPGWRAYSYAEASGWTLFSTVLATAIVCEGIPLHLLLRKWSFLAAWICTGLDLYGLLWVIALGRAARLRTILVNEEWIALRIGMLWELEFRRDNVLECRRVAGVAPRRRAPGYLANTVINEALWMIQFRTPVKIRSLWGQSRTVTRMGVAVDDEARFSAEMRK